MTENKIQQTFKSINTALQIDSTFVIEKIDHNINQEL